MKLYDLDVNPEICCDLCGENAYNWFDCPVCIKTVQTRESHYLEKKVSQITCSKCHTIFILIEGSGPYEIEARYRIKLI